MQRKCSQTQTSEAGASTLTLCNGDAAEAGPVSEAMKITAVMNRAAVTDKTLYACLVALCLVNQRRQVLRARREAIKNMINLLCAVAIDHRGDIRSLASVPPVQELNRAGTVFELGDESTPD